MRLWTIALAAALLAGPAAAHDTKSQQKQTAQEQEQEKAQGAKGADTHEADREQMKGYGYGTPAGVEANDGDRQAAAEGVDAKTPQQEEGASVTEKDARVETGTLSGKIVSTAKDRITLEAPGGMRDIQVTDATEVEGAGRSSVEQLRRGDEVRVSFDPAEGVSVAKRIEVRAVGGKASPDAPPAGHSTPPAATEQPGQKSPTESATPEAPGTGR